MGKGLTTALTVACALALTPSLAAASPGDSIGSALQIVNLVTAGYARDTRTLQVGDSVRQDEIIDVGLDARSEFQLNDDTKLALGPGSHLVLDKFVYDPDKATGSIILDLTKGTMRWITGAAKKPTYVIRVPNAAITVRGTIFDLSVTDNGDTWLLLHEGAVQVCNDRGQCRVHAESCKLTLISNSGEVSSPMSWGNLPGARDNMFHRAFPFVVLPPDIDPNPVCTRDAVMNQRDASIAPQETEPEPPAPKVRKASVESKYVPSSAVDEPEVRPAKRTRTATRVPVKEVESQPVRPVRAKKPASVRPQREAKAEPVIVPVKPREKKPDYVRPQREAKAAPEKPQSMERNSEPRVRTAVPKRPVRYAGRDRDDDDDRKYRKPRRDRDDHEDRDRPHRDGGGFGRVLLGAAVVGAIALGSLRGHHGGGYGGY